MKLALLILVICQPDPRCGGKVASPAAVAALAKCDQAIAQSFAVHAKDQAKALTAARSLHPCPSEPIMPAPTRPAIISAIYLLHADPQGPRLRLEEDMKIALVEQLAELSAPTQQRWERRFADAGITLEA